MNHIHKSHCNKIENIACTVNPVLSDNINQYIFLPFQTGGCLSSHLSVAISMPLEWWSLKTGLIVRPSKTNIGSVNKTTLFHVDSENGVLVLKGGIWL